MPISTVNGIVDRNEGVRRGSTVEAMGTLTTPFKEDGVVSAGNASQIADGASELLMMTSEKTNE